MVHIRGAVALACYRGHGGSRQRAGARTTLGVRDGATCRGGEYKVMGRKG
jgi:hypothetical protein